MYGWRYGVAVVCLSMWAVGPAAAGIDWPGVEREAVDRLQAYVRLDTTNPPGNETPAAELLRGWLAADGIEARTYDPMGNPVRLALVARLPGSSGHTLVLMSHSDVVPAIASEWSQPPFAGNIVNDVLYGRGTVDTKSLGILELMSMVLLHRQGLRPRDDILLLIEPDEEEGGLGIDGMLEKFPELFRTATLVLNEGGFGVDALFRPGQTIFFVQSAEKGPAWMKVTAHGDSGHASVPLANNAVVLMARALVRIAAYRTPVQPSPTTVKLFRMLAAEQSFPTSFVMRHIDNGLIRFLFGGRLTERPLANSLLRTTISITGVHGGYKTNVIPAEVEATIDCRVNVGDDPESLRQQLTRVVGDPHVTIELTHAGMANESPISEPLMQTMRAVTSTYVPNSFVAPLMSSGVTDSAAFRQRRVPAFGFNPLILTEPEVETAHGIDERIPLAGFRTAVHIYYDVVARLSGAAPGK